jgi:hypothetical protein
MLRSDLAVLILFRGAAQGQPIQYGRDCGQNELIQPIRAYPPFVPCPSVYCCTH